MKVYIAAPFFNDPQLELVKQVEAACTKYDVDYISPRSFGVLAPEDGEKPQKDILSQNVAGILSTDLVIACLEFRLNPGIVARLVGGSMAKQGNIMVPIKPTLHLGPVLTMPDSGTVWEMGYAVGKGKRVVGFVDAKPSDYKMNVMLAQTMSGILVGFSHLNRFLYHGPNWDEAKPWTGRIT